jgi:hypothetical protein
MKTLLTLLMLGCLLLASCTTPSHRLVTESDTGKVYDASHLDALRGMASGQRDAEQMRFARDIIATAGKPTIENGVRYTGRVKVITWTHKGQPTFTALREADFDGLLGWQGPQAPSGFYSANLTTEILN